MLRLSPAAARVTSDKPYFQAKSFTLLHSDAIAALSHLPAESVDIIFADPPYNLSNGGFTVHAGRMVSVNKGDWDKTEGFEDDYRFITTAGLRRAAAF